MTYFAFMPNAVHPPVLCAGTLRWSEVYTQRVRVMTHVDKMLQVPRALLGSGPHRAVLLLPCPNIPRSISEFGVEKERAMMLKAVSTTRCRVYSEHPGRAPRLETFPRPCCCVI